MSIAPAADSLLIDGILGFDVPTDRLTARVLERAGADPDATPLVLVHGNCSSSLFFMRLMLALPATVRPIAVDLRGYGNTDTLPVDATRGLSDFADDVWAVLDALGLDRVHLFGWSMGGGVITQMMLDQPARVSSLILQNPVSPYGFGGTKGADGELCFTDAAGSGGGGANPRFVELIAKGDGDGELDADGNPETASPRNTVRALYVAPGSGPWPDEDLWVASLLTTKVGDDNYPGTGTASENWPTLAPGDRGVLNTMTPNHLRWDGVVDLDPKPPVLWLRGEVDQIISDTSGLDFAFLGQVGVVPGWPGEDLCPPQPMVTQTRTVLGRYQAAGGQVREVAYPGVGHSPHLEVQDQVVQVITEHLG